MLLSQFIDLWTIFVRESGRYHATKDRLAKTTKESPNNPQTDNLHNFLVPKFIQSNLVFRYISEAACTPHEFHLHQSVCGAMTQHTPAFTHNLEFKKYTRRPVDKITLRVCYLQPSSARSRLGGGVAVGGSPPDCLCLITTMLSHSFPTLVQV